MTDGRALKTEYTYDGLNRLWTIQNKKGSGVLSSYTYLYDNNGNITSVTEALNNGAGKTTNYVYDALNRLSSITRPDGGGIASYTYDLQGNRQSVSDTSINLSEFTNTSYTNDLENTLTGVTNDNILTSINYLPNGLRYEKMTGTVKTQYNYNGNGEVVSESKSNGQKATYIRGDRLLVKKDRTTAKDYYYLYNGHGDVVQIVDTTGTVVNSYAYDVWGSITNQTEGVTNSFKYAGEIYDEESGLYYLRARYYDPSVGRFLNEDTYEGEWNNPLTLNLYSYVFNNPLKYIDPSGHVAIGVDSEMWRVNGLINDQKAKWMLANDSNNKAGMKAANAEAERIRKQYSHVSGILQASAPYQYVSYVESSDKTKIHEVRIKGNGDVLYEMQSGYEYYTQSNKYSPSDKGQQIFGKASLDLSAGYAFNLITKGSNEVIKKTLEYAGGVAFSEAIQTGIESSGWIVTPM
ncbi:RHS repeat domain-containing protein [Paenibacillus sp. FA6]|uniref:RHS repeat domain-containing protein n=1 Tax=Paenibacillus sp. FA6 TaxID=3413029 RepID=UPI003F65D013